MTWAKNEAKGHRDRKNGINNKMNKSVIQLTLDGKVIKVHHSQNHASRVTGIKQGNINKVCRGIRKTAGGFKWQYGETI